MQPAFGVIGLGRMAQALVVPLLESGRVRADQLLAVVGGSGSLEQRREALPAGIALVAPTILPLNRFGRPLCSCLR